MEVYLLFLSYWTVSSGLDCQQSQFKCRDEYVCISALWVCDGYVDCYDASDENNCNLSSQVQSATTSTTTSTSTSTTPMTSTSTSTSTTPMTSTSTTPMTSTSTTRNLMTPQISKTVPTTISSPIHKDVTTATRRLASRAISATLPLSLTTSPTTFTRFTTTTMVTSSSTSFLIRPNTTITSLSATQAPTTTTVITTYPETFTSSSSSSPPSSSSTTTTSLTITTSNSYRSTVVTSTSTPPSSSSEIIINTSSTSSPFILPLTSHLCSMPVAIAKCRNNLECVPEVYVCDGIIDCMDGSDEEACGNLCIEPSDVLCVDGTCKKTSVRCLGLSSCFAQKNYHYCTNITYESPPVNSIEAFQNQKRACLPIYEFTCSNKNCIPHQWKCDGVNDCFDYSDEASCPMGACPWGYFTCKGVKNCIGFWNVCNRHQDCNDGSDELNCKYAEIKDPVIRLTSSSLYWTVKRSCFADEFKCSDNVHASCLPLSWRCDGVMDCRNGEDELYCWSSVVRTCEETKRQRSVFQCYNENKSNNNSNNMTSLFPSCVDPSFRCDWTSDCSDGSDEIGCYCDPDMTKMRCLSFQCFSSTGWCDGVKDCTDDTDEKYCDWIRCPHNSFKCVPLNKCLPLQYRCNRLVDCPGGSDEMNCSCPHDRSFQCEDLEKCVEFGRFCDNKRDCSDGSDEPDDCKSKCAPNLFQCSVSRECIHPSSVCDTIRDCSDGTDEESCQVEEA